MLLVIFDVPACLSTKIIGTSFIEQPELKSSLSNFYLKRITIRFNIGEIKLLKCFSPGCLKTAGSIFHLNDRIKLICLQINPDSLLELIINAVLHPGQCHGKQKSSSMN